MKLKGLSLFFPCHNEEANIEGVVLSAIKVAPLVAEDVEVLIVDDGSRDRTAEIVLRLAERDRRVRLVRHPVNRGYGEALKTGFRSCRLPWIFYSDGDGQFDLAELPRLTARAAGADIVSGFRIHRADPWNRKLNAKIFEIALRLFMGLRVRDVDSAFKLYRREVFDHIELKSHGALIDAEVLSKAQARGFRVVQLGVSHLPRRAGLSSGARPAVVLKAMLEFWKLWWDLQMLKRAALPALPGRAERVALRPLGHPQPAISRAKVPEESLR